MRSFEMTNNANDAIAGIPNLLDSLERVTARLLETTTANNQLATSQTPEMRRLFDAWLSCITGELSRVADEWGGTCDIEKLAQQVGLSNESVLSLLLAMERQGKIVIKSVTLEKGDGRNRDICDCLN